MYFRLKVWLAMFASGMFGCLITAGFLRQNSDFGEFMLTGTFVSVCLASLIALMWKE